MTEQEWLTSNEPYRMLEELQIRRDDDDHRGYRLPSDRKLHLFACACCVEAGIIPADDLDLDRYETEGVWGRTAENWAMGWCGDQEKPSVAWRAAILRDICGNPFHQWSSIKAPKPNLAYVLDERWLSPTVLSIAQAIYTTRRFEDMPILGDALEDAGCDNQDVLSHCRDQWVMPPVTVDVLTDIREGKAPIKIAGHPNVHVRGCWVLDLILGKS